jgi:hypothetical protein
MKVFIFRSYESEGGEELELEVFSSMEAAERFKTSELVEHYRLGPGLTGDERVDTINAQMFYQMSADRYYYEIYERVVQD